LFYYIYSLFRGKGYALIYFSKKKFTVEGEGGYKFMFFFPPSFDMWKEEGKHVKFFFKFFFPLLSGWGGGRQGYIYIYIC
jgi:hypothetical protein